MTKRFYIKLEDIIRLAYDIDPNAKVRPYDALEADSGMDMGTMLTTFIRDGDPVADTDNSALTEFKKYIFPKYLGEVIDYIDIDYDFIWQTPDTPSSEAVIDYLASPESVLGKIYVWWQNTLNYYPDLIKLYSDNKTNLMNQINSNVINKFNDTPQNVNDSFASDDYVTNITQISTGTDGDSMINRLNDIRNKIENLYNTWCNGFERFIITVNKGE